MTASLIHTASRRTLTVGLVAGLHVLFGIGLLLGTLVTHLPDRPAPVIGRLLPDAPSAAPVDRNSTMVQFDAVPVPLPKQDDEPVIHAPDARPDPSDNGPGAAGGDDVVSRTPLVPVVTPVQLSATGRQELMDSCADRYPAAARRDHEEGVVRLLVLVSADGRGVDATIESDGGHPRLAQANIACVRAAGRVFVPKRSGDQPIASWQSMSYRWQIAPAGSLGR